LSLTHKNTAINYVDPPDLHRNKQFTFPSLHNTQIFECDFFDDESDFWKQNKKFDWIVGNPPWIELKPDTVNEELARSWIRRNIEERPATGNRVCEAFIWRVIDLLAPNGSIGLLIHAKSLFNHESERYRKQFFTQHQVLRITNFSKGASQICNKHKYPLSFCRFQGMIRRLKIAKNQSSNKGSKMTPELKARIDHHTKELAAALWQLDHPGEMSNLETIEMVVRDQVLTHVSPQIALFLSKKQREPRRGGLGQ
jgi:hypothetical protein